MSVFDRIVFKERIKEFGSKVAHVCDHADLVYSTEYDVQKIAGNNNMVSCTPLAFESSFFLKAYFSFFTVSLFAVLKIV